MTDEQLLIRYRDIGDQDSFTELVGRLQAELVAFLRTKVGSDAEDVAQKTWMRILRHAGRFDGRPLRPWLYTIASRLAIDTLRSNRGTVLLHDNIPGPEPARWLSNLGSAVDSLPDDSRKAVELVYMRGYRYSEAAKELGIPVGTVKSRLASARTRLRNKPCLR